jgi:hypothetical protein
MGAGFFYAWLHPARPWASAWIESAGALIFTELGVTLLIGPLLLAATHGRPPGWVRVLTPGALGLQAAAYVVLYQIWRAQDASALVGVSYAASVALRTVDIARGDENALLNHKARMIIWFCAIALAGLVALILMPVQRFPQSAGWAMWSVSACGAYFLLLVCGEIALPFFRRNVDPRIHPEDHVT